MLGTTFLPLKIAKRQNRLQREVVQSSPLEILKTIWHNLTSDPPLSKRLDQRPPYVLSSLNDSVLL